MPDFTTRRCGATTGSSPARRSGARRAAHRRPADQRPARRPPHAGVLAWPPRPTCTATRRCRSTTATPATSRARSVKDYRYPNDQPARTLWYHDHGVHHTAQNVYFGLAAQYHLHDPVERALLPQGEFDVPLIDLRHHVRRRRPAAVRRPSAVRALWGDVILVNGAPWPVMKVEPRMYRFRFLNASISRGYRLAARPTARRCMVVGDRRRADAASRRRSPSGGTAGPSATRC